MAQDKIQRPETVLFVGAGATQQLSMPTTGEQAGFLWTFCDSELTAEAVEEATAHSGCFKGRGQCLVDMLTLLDGGPSGDEPPKFSCAFRERVFPGLSEAEVGAVVFRLRRRYDWGALKLVAKAKKGNSNKKEPIADYVQMVFTLIDACVRENRGFAVYDENNARVFLSVNRLQTARETLVLIENTMFACAWSNAVKNKRGELEKYRAFFRSLAKAMQEEGGRFLDAGCRKNLPEFYQFSYSLLTTNFDPLFLWFIWTAHDKVNHEAEVRLDNPGRGLKLLMNFPNTVGMRRPIENDGERSNADIWFPCTDAAAQNVNNPKHGDDRIVRIGKYYAVHGMSNTRLCPMCGRLNLYVGDTWDEDSASLFPNGIVEGLAKGAAPRTEKEREARKRGEYDALSCHFCGELTHSYDNFMFMQTQLKNLPPSFIKETTDEALAGIAGAKHIVLLGYSMPLDDAIWGSLLTAMSRRKKDERLYCSVAATYDKDGPEGWLYGKTLDDYIERYAHSRDEYEKIRAIENATAVFGKENVRAYVRGVPNVFGSGTVEDVRRLLYPYDQAGWNIPEFMAGGVARGGRRT